MSANNLPQLDVLFEDNHLLVVNKPPLLPTMGVGPDEDSLFRRASVYLKQKYNKPGNAYVGVVSRLDSFTSGLIVLAKTSKAASRLSDQMRRQVVQKHYLAIIPSGLSPSFGNLEDRVVKNDARKRMVVIPPKDPLVAGEKQASLRYRTLATSGSLQLLEVELQTGRKHQIRVQLENAGFPILGDRKYGSQDPFKRGIALHCFRLSFEHPTLKDVQSFQSDPPEWWPMERFQNT